MGIKNVILAGKAVVAYIKHSPPVQSALHSLQKEAGVLKPHKVKQDMPVRWDTKYHCVGGSLLSPPAPLHPLEGGAPSS